MKTTTLKHNSVHTTSLCLLASILIYFGFSEWLPAQVLQHRYGFTSNASDSVACANGTLADNAYVTNGALVLPGGGNSANPSGYVVLPDGIVSNDNSITVECWLTDTKGLTWAGVERLVRA
jgi:hypothetical protein